MHLVVDQQLIPFEEGDSLLETLLRAGLHPTDAGCLCNAGDCGNCLVSVEGEAYTRSCQTKSSPGLVVERNHAGGEVPPLEREGSNVAQPARHLHCDVVVLGGGESGQGAARDAESNGHEVVVFDAGAGQEVIGIYPGPVVVARSAAGMLHAHPRREIVVATGAAEIQPVCPGSQLRGVFTPRAARQLQGRGLDLGRVVSLSASPTSEEFAESVAGSLVRFEGEDGRLTGVVLTDENGREHVVPCDSACVDLGRTPRDVLVRMARTAGDVEVRVVGDAALESDLPKCPSEGTVCPCSQVTVADLDRVWNAGFQELELMKRATLAGTGTCQGSVCMPHLRSFLLDRGKTLQPPFTARPFARQPTLSELAAGAHAPLTARTALHEEHVNRGAELQRMGGWWRPWTYRSQSADDEYWAVRSGVSLCDVSTLGKFVVGGPDAGRFLDFLCPSKVSSLKDGRLRYVLFLDERGYVFDDGIVARDGEQFEVTFTSSGATHGEMWLRDWAEGRFDVRILNKTMALAAINVTGPESARLLQRAGASKLPDFGGHDELELVGIACRAFRMSFTGELSYELHLPAADARRLWRALVALGSDLGVRPHGLETLMTLRLEKGHIVVGQDTDYDSTLRRIDHEWARKLTSRDFVGRQAVVRTDRIALDRQLVGLELDGPAPEEGAVIWSREEPGPEPMHDYLGYVTSAAWSPALGRSVCLGWVELRDGSLPNEVFLDGRRARRYDVPFYDPEGERSRAVIADDRRESRDAASSAPATAPTAPADSWSYLTRLDGWRLVASPNALDNATWPNAELVLRLAEDEVLLLPSAEALSSSTDGQLADPHAVSVRDTSFAGLWASEAQVHDLAAAHCEWPLPAERPALAQGSVAGIPAKLWLETGRALVLVPTAFAEDFEQRTAATLAEVGL